MPEAEDVPWYERFPESVEWERDQFRRYGFTVDERIGDFGLVFEVDLAIGTVKVPVKVVYPPEFPEIHPTVYGPSPAMSRHQNPSELNFCLGGASETWLPTDSAAGLVIGLVELLRADANGDAGLIHATEADMPEPVSVYLAATSTGTVLVPDPYWDADCNRQSKRGPPQGGNDRVKGDHLDPPGARYGARCKGRHQSGDRHDQGG